MGPRRADLGPGRHLRGGGIGDPPDGKLLLPADVEHDLAKGGHRSHGRGWVARAVEGGREVAALEAGDEGGMLGDSWKGWHAKDQVSNLTSLQRGARNFESYCLGCHSLKYMRYEIEVPEDIRVPADRALQRMFDATEGGTLRSEVFRK